MFKTNTDRTKWGIETKRLKSNSRVIKLDIDGIPCLLQDIEITAGGRMQMYSFFVQAHPKMMYSVQFICDDVVIWNKHSDEISKIVKSIKVVRKTEE